MSLKRYTVTVQWLNISSKTRYSIKSKTMKLWARDLMTASREALSQFQDKIHPGISSIWADWPQPKVLHGAS